MNKPDARRLNPIIQNYLRQQAIRLREQGKRMGDHAVYLGVHRTTVSGWWRQYQQEGKAALNQQPRGAKFGEGRTLSPAEEATVQRLLREPNADLTPLRGNKLWQLGLLEWWLQSHQVG